ncbi:hypothetical protein GC175_32855 [bacterium]|nr:hypothetical protein [bacterium]
MSYQNRVTPTREIIATPARGTFMGNRGVLHNPEGEIVRTYQGKRWITCLLDFKGRHRRIMTPGSYTELFFLDEATALAAGHRPCRECRRRDFDHFAARRRTVKGGTGRAEEMDCQLHVERMTDPKQTYDTLDNLPDGVFVQNGNGEALLIWQRQLHLWMPFGYSTTLPLTTSGPFTLLTPPSTVQVIRAGYTPVVHTSAVSDLNARATSWES